MSWFVRHRPEGDTSAEAAAVEVTAPRRPTRSTRCAPRFQKVTS